MLCTSSTGWMVSTLVYSALPCQLENRLPLSSVANHPYDVQNAENVPHTAIKVQMPSRATSYQGHRPVITIFADIGPMTQMTKAEKEPRKAIRELNCGIRIETRIDMAGTMIRSSATKKRVVRLVSPSGGDPFPPSTEVATTVLSKPSILSKMRFSYNDNQRATRQVKAEITYWSSAQGKL